MGGLQEVEHGIARQAVDVGVEIVHPVEIRPLGPQPDKNRLGHILRIGVVLQHALQKGQHTWIVALEDSFKGSTIACGKLLYNFMGCHQYAYFAEYAGKNSVFKL